LWLKISLSKFALHFVPTRYEKRYRVNQAFRNFKFTNFRRLLMFSKKEVLYLTTKAESAYLLSVLMSFWKRAGRSDFCVKHEEWTEGRVINDF